MGLTPCPICGGSPPGLWVGAECPDCWGTPTEITVTLPSTLGALAVLDVDPDARLSTIGWAGAEPWVVGIRTCYPGRWGITPTGHRHPSPVMLPEGWTATTTTTTRKARP
mgnify:CR=1 FL=1